MKPYTRKPCTYNGIDYPSITIAATENGLTVDQMRRRLRQATVKPSHIPCTYNGKHYESILACAKDNHYSHAGMWNIIKRQEIEDDAS